MRTREHTLTQTRGRAPWCLGDEGLAPPPVLHARDGAESAKLMKTGAGWSATSNVPPQVAGHQGGYSAWRRQQQAHNRGGNCIHPPLLTINAWLCAEPALPQMLFEDKIHPWPLLRVSWAWRRLTRQTDSLYINREKNLFCAIRVCWHDTCCHWEVRKSVLVLMLVQTDFQCMGIA